MVSRLLPALAAATAITFLLLLALPMLAVRGKQQADDAQLAGVRLFFEEPAQWNRQPEPRKVEHERFKDQRLDLRADLPNALLPDVMAPDLATGQGPGLALDLGLDPRQGTQGLSLADITFEVAQVDEPPRVIRQIPPEYPMAALRKGLVGQVELRFLVERDGAVAQVQVISADPPGAFEDSAMRAVKSWRFTPGMYQGEPVRTWVRIPIAFELE